MLLRVLQTCFSLGSGAFVCGNDSSLFHVDLKVMSRNVKTNLVSLSFLLFLLLLLFPVVADHLPSTFYVLLSNFVMIDGEFHVFKKMLIFEIIHFISNKWYDIMGQLII